MSTQAEVQVSYDVGNEFFRLWLDKRMNYTCGIYDETDDLDEAQIAKLNFLHDQSKITPEGSILDIGCGWGANIEFLAQDKGVKDVHGITLSPAQFEEINARKIPNVTAHCVNYLDYKPDRLFDAVISICMIEHVVTPEQARAGEHIDLYRNYFRLAHEWTKPGAHFALQTILRNRAPRNRKDIQDIGWMTYEIFPGGITPRLEDIVIAVNPYWEVKQVTTRRVDYQKTCAHWLEGLKRSEDFIREKWGSQVFEDYDRYLSTCVRAFEMHYQSLAQWQLKRID
ncbi:MAG: class I SAM-dependent methyltransferase [Deltaproteobacteria bacterium]|jgi:cyclopropane-fatty-acyl-phospholipid synthase|nr:class I SAM-dependent methyltransferase [Deltaproteobacteria bacterium]MBT6435672.1 class I SAM-dependent methyltransferase [Deltaproteobacteria bacterium]MBT6492227.1 class I SAM-dependent methyltransferase [Deltaproteobacteria bacterium]